VSALELSLEEVLASTARVISDLEQAHGDLAQHAARVEAELAVKVEELDRAHARLAAVLSALPTGVLVRDAEGRLETANQAACEVFGLEAEACGAAADAQLANAATGRSTEVRRADGSPRQVVVRCATVHDAEGQVIGSVQTLDDQTDLVAAERRLQQQSKLASLGTLAGGIAHEVRNPLNAIRGFGSLMATELQDDERLGRWASHIVSGADEVEEIVAATMRLARSGEVAAESVSARELAQEAVQLAQSTRPEAVRTQWRIEVAGTDQACSGERIELRQALRNLIVNAMDAQPKGGTVRITVDSCDAWTTFQVDDAGPGVSAEIADRVREPFFTTRAEGTGLGLALVHSIADLHGGELELDAEPSRLGGACFRLRVPSQA
jgi:signal transduction histidine kinase